MGKQLNNFRNIYNNSKLLKKEGKHKKYKKREESKLGVTSEYYWLIGKKFTAKEIYVRS